MAGSRKLDADEIDPDVLAAAQQLVDDRKRREKWRKNPWWTCSACGFENHPRTSHPDWSKCEQCGKERDDNDPVNKKGTANDA